VPATSPLPARALRSRTCSAAAERLCSAELRSTTYTDENRRSLSSLLSTVSLEQSRRCLRHCNCRLPAGSTQSASGYRLRGKPECTSDHHWLKLRSAVAGRCRSGRLDEGKPALTAATHTTCGDPTTTPFHSADVCRRP